MCDSFGTVLESENAFFDEIYFDDEEEDESLLEDADFFDDEIMLNTNDNQKKFRNLELSKGPSLCLDETLTMGGCHDCSGFLSEIRELRDLLGVMDDPKEISDIRARIRGKRLQFLMGLQKEKILRDDLLQLILLFEASEDQSDELLDEIFTHEQFLDEFCPLELERGEGFREAEDSHPSLWVQPELVYPCSP